MSEEQDAGRAGSPLPAEKPKWPKKPPKTAEDLAAIAYLDALRAGGGDTPPVRVPLACIVKVTAYEEVPKAHEAYAMVRVVGPDGRCSCLRRRRCPSRTATAIRRCAR